MAGHKLSYYGLVMLMAVLLILACSVDTTGPELDDDPEPDPVPLAIENLRINAYNTNHIDVIWTAPDSALVYDVRYSTDSITDSNWTDAIQCVNEAAPRPGGSVEILRIYSLSNNQDYYFAMKYEFDSVTISPLSNIAFGFTRYRSWNQIAYTKGGQVWTVLSNGNEDTVITNSSEACWWPQWSPDGSALCYYKMINGIYNIYRMNPDGSSETRLTDEAGGSGFNWSPDGTRLVYQSGNYGQTVIKVMNSDGTDVQNLTGATYNSQYPSWSPDGQKITFETDRDGNWEIYTANADGTNQVNITNSITDERTSTWSPTGNKIAYKALSKIYVLDLTSDLVTELAPDGFEVGMYSWSPNGSAIAYENYDHTGEGPRIDIYTVNVNGTGRIRVNPDHHEFVEWPAWSRNGYQVIYVWDRDYSQRLVIAGYRGGVALELNLGNTIYSPVWSPSGR